MLSLSVRLFGNIFGEELVILILASIIPFVLPLPMMFLGLVTSALQAFIFVMLTMIYLAGAVVGGARSGSPRRARRGPRGRKRRGGVSRGSGEAGRGPCALVRTRKAAALLILGGGVYRA